ncbi:hypothetical protein NEMBOFW57_005258 [Staphylotrichum longicolle]|uniref:Uncharacterized protein n=1 Tax=Staphylotrichum longicolle TaxID=669026 RepID=A0AAD4EWG8_9PEZI|nr:hypothetical protein NEMBOFW57_005258 [Staphylotrichum longicolle]
MSATQGTYSSSLSMSPPPPADLGSYARTMHQHTKRQMESISQSPQRSSQNSQSSHYAPTGLPDGVQGRNRDPNQYSYHQS